MFRRLMIALAIPVLLCSLASAQTVDDLIAKNNKARGGLDKMKAAKTMKITAKMFMQGMEAPATLMFKRPGKVRIEFTLQGMTGIQAYDGTNAWMIMPFMGKTEAEKMTAEDAKDVQEQSDFDGPLVDYKDKGNKVEFVGKEDMEGTPVYKLRVTLKSGDIREIYLDGENYLEVKESSKRKTQGAEIQVDTYLSDYKKVGDLMLPHAMESKVKDQSVSQITITKVDLNGDLPDSLFKMPAKADSTAKAPAAKAAEAPKPEAKPDSTKK